MRHCIDVLADAGEASLLGGLAPCGLVWLWREPRATRFLPPRAMGCSLTPVRRGSKPAAAVENRFSVIYFVYNTVPTWKIAPIAMPFALLTQAFRRGSARRILPASKPLGDRYDVVIIGGGGHGLATAYYLAKDHGIRNVAVLEKGYLAGGNTARNTAIVRSNYLTVEGVAFYAESVSLFRKLSDELDFNIMYSERGHLTLAHTDAAIRTSRWRAEVNKHLNVNSELIGPDEIRRICPQLNLSNDVALPDPGSAVSPAGSDRSPRRGGLGLRGRGGTIGRGYPRQHRGHRDHQAGESRGRS